MRIFRHNPDLIALAALALLMATPAVWAVHPPRSSDVFRFHSASFGEMQAQVDPDAMDGFEDIADWTTTLERRGERVWQRLSERMRKFEAKFEKHSLTTPRSRSIYCEADSE